jgi:hypothetical protein
MSGSIWNLGQTRELFFHLRLQPHGYGCAVAHDVFAFCVRMYTLWYDGRLHCELTFRRFRLCLPKEEVCAALCVTKISEKSANSEPRASLKVGCLHVLLPKPCIY